LFLLEKTNNDWWHVRRSGGQDGFVPANYVQETEPKVIQVQVRRPEKIKVKQKVKKIQMVQQTVPVRKQVKQPRKTNIYPIIKTVLLIIPLQLVPREDLIHLRTLALKIDRKRSTTLT
jgi:uncharacterized protein YgiM (DUF1202 family)